MVSASTKCACSAKHTLLANARRMRHESTDAEQKLWRAVRGRRFGGYKFKRQYPIGRYIVDFVCLEERLIIELDGGQHALHEEYDSERTAYLEAKSFRAIRYWNDVLLKHTDEVLEDILRVLRGGATPSPAER